MTDLAKVAVVTGAGQGLGRAISLALSAEGFRVVLIGRTLSKLEATAGLCTAATLCVPCDLTDPQQVRSAFSLAATTFGQIDVLINNAAAYAMFAIDEASDDQIVSLVNQSLIAPIFCTREAISAMRERGCGDIVNISTQSVVSPQPMMSIYAAAKGGLETFARALRNELRGQGIRVTTVQIGIVAGTGVPNWSRGERERYGMAMRKAGLEKAFVFPGSQPDDIAGAVVRAVTAPPSTVIEDIVIRGFEVQSFPVDRRRS